MSIRTFSRCIFAVIRTFSVLKGLSAENNTMFQQAKGVGLAVGGGEGEEVGGLGAGGEV